MDTDQPLGRLIKTERKDCPNCVSTIMQLRGRKVIELIRGVEVELEEEYYHCPSCHADDEIRFRDRKKRELKIDKTAYEITEKRGRGNGDTKKSTRPESNFGEKSRRDFRKDSRRSS